MTLAKMYSTQGRVSLCPVLIPEPIMEQALNEMTDEWKPGQTFQYGSSMDQKKNKQPWKPAFLWL